MTVYDENSASTYHALTDHLGTVHALVDEHGAVAESYDYDAWGNVLGVYDAAGQPLPTSGIGNRYLFQGREYSWDTGLYNFRNRWYDPSTGRWLSNDPIGIAGGLNQYVAFANNPVMYVDPWGLSIEHYDCDSLWDRIRRRRMMRRVERIQESRWRSMENKLRALRRIERQYRGLRGATRYVNNAISAIENPSLEQWGRFSVETLQQLTPTAPAGQVIRKNRIVDEMYREAERQDREVHRLHQYLGGNRSIGELQFFDEN